MHDTIFVLDFGSQYAHLITRRIRELGVFSELLPPDAPLETLKAAKGIIISGGPQSVHARGSLKIDPRVFELGVPVLGICYGMQLMAHMLGGRVVPSKIREYGLADITVLTTNTLFRKKKQRTWMSHGDTVSKLPKGFKGIAKSKNCPHAAFINSKRKLYGVQFHPEVAHTEDGMGILKRFVSLTDVRASWSLKGFVQKSIKDICAQVGKDEVVCGLSGGVDSSVAASLVHRAVGNKLTCIFVDTGFMRKGEVEQVVHTFRKHQKIKLRVIRAEKQFLTAVKGVTDPEKKRKKIGELFIRLFEKEAHKIGKAKWLVQGTLYTDAISSGVSVGKKAAVIKSHHNVGGLPEKFGFTLLEPLRELYKDEVRKVGRLIGLPQVLTQRQPFPGPGLAVRIIGAITKEAVEIVREADAIVTEEIEKAKLHKSIQQYFAVLPKIKSVGVQGDGRTYGYPIIVRAVTTQDFMTADWARIPDHVLTRISNRITNEIQAVNRVVYDVTSKPPGTVEWE